MPHSRCPPLATGLIERRITTMTEKRRLELEEKLNDAEASGDAARIAAVKKTMEQEYRTCTSHTADRLKRVEETVNEIKDGLIPANMFEEIKEGQKNISDTVSSLKRQTEAWKNRARGMKILWTILGYIAAAGGGSIIMKFLLASQKVAVQ